VYFEPVITNNAFSVGYLD